MSAAILYWGILTSQMMLGVALLLILSRLLRGHRAQDRIVALDTLYVTTMMLLLTFGIRSQTNLYFEAALVIALLGFVSTIALAKFLMRGEVIE